MSPKTTPSVASVSAAAAVRPRGLLPAIMLYPRLRAAAATDRRPRAPAPSPCDRVATPRAPDRSFREPEALNGPSVTLITYPVGARPSEQSEGAGSTRHSSRHVNAYSIIWIPVSTRGKGKALSSPSAQLSNFLLPRGFVFRRFHVIGSRGLGVDRRISRRRVYSLVVGS